MELIIGLRNQAKFAKNILRGSFWWEKVLFWRGKFTSMLLFLAALSAVGQRAVLLVAFQAGHTVAWIDALSF